MANANTTLNIAELDFSDIKSNFKSYLSGQDVFKDYDFEGSAMSIILDILAYNTHYNAYYLNMVANEMFLDTATKRSSAISHAKLLNYRPRSAVAPRARVDITFTGVVTPTFTIPKYTKFYSEAIDNVNYPFVTLEAVTVDTSANTASFGSVNIYQGQPVKYSFTVNNTDNPTQVFKLPDANIDVSTLKVSVFATGAATTYDVYEQVTNHLTLGPTSKVFFTQEALDGSYEIYFGDGILGKKLSNLNVVVVEYLITKGTVSNGVGSFTLIDDIGTYDSTIITVQEKALGGQTKEGLSSIKFTAPKARSAQYGVVTKADYISVLQNNNSIVPIEAVNVWGGEELLQPQFGKMFICIKPQSGYTITQAQKFRLLNDVIKPISVITTIPVIVDPDYTYLKFAITAIFNKSISIYDQTQLSNLLKTALVNFTGSNLDKFNTNFVLPDLIVALKNVDSSIITTDIVMKMQKRFFPIFNIQNSVDLEFDTVLKPGTLSSNYFDYVALDTSQIIRNCKLEETPSTTNHVDGIEIVTPGSGYTSIPTVTIYGDGAGATAVAEVTNGVVTGITVTNQGAGYTQAIVLISGGGGTGATAVVALSGSIVTIRSYCFNNGIKTVVQSNVGQINYNSGVVTLTNFQPYSTEDPLGRFSVDVEPKTSLIESTKDKILTLDIMDKAAIAINVVVK